MALQLDGEIMFPRRRDVRSVPVTQEYANVVFDEFNFDLSAGDNNLHDIYQIFSGIGFTILKTRKVIFLYNFTIDNADFTDIQKFGIKIKLEINDINKDERVCEFFLDDALGENIFNGGVMKHSFEGAYAESLAAGNYNVKLSVKPNNTAVESNLEMNVRGSIIGLIPNK